MELDAAPSLRSAWRFRGRRPVGRSSSVASAWQLHGDSPRALCGLIHRLAKIGKHGNMFIRIFCHGIFGERAMIKPVAESAWKLGNSGMLCIVAAALVCSAATALGSTNITTHHYDNLRTG